MTPEALVELAAKWAAAIAITTVIVAFVSWLACMVVLIIWES
jgi:hypothetical protein